MIDNKNVHGSNCVYLLALILKLETVKVCKHCHQSAVEGFAFSLVTQQVFVIAATVFY